MKHKLILIACFMFYFSAVHSQTEWQPGQRKNVIKINPTPMLLWDVRNITISYERLIKPNHSLSIKVGYLVFPRLLSDTILGIAAIHGGSKYGLNLGLEYRYYPFSRNRRPSPDGLYIGPYVSYYGNHFSNNIDVIVQGGTNNGDIKGSVNVFNLGFQVGYQFIFWKRVSLDLILFGPSISAYWGNLAVDGNITGEMIQNIDSELVKAILNKYPYLKTLFNEKELTFTGSKASLSLGFRYAIQLGIAF